MAYINFKYCYKKGLDNTQILALQAIHQNANGDSEFVLDTIPTATLVELNDLGFLKTVKAKNKSQKRRALVRLSNKGKELYTSITTYKLSEGDEQIYNFISDVYKQLDKQQASRNKMLKLIASFRLESGMSTEEMYLLCKAYVNDSNNMEYNNKLEYVFFKPENAYSKFNLGDSRLWSYYLQHGI